MSVVSVGLVVSALGHDQKIAGSSPARCKKGFCQNETRPFFSQDFCQEGIFFDLYNKI